jgi:hypothetical protein
MSVTLTTFSKCLRFLEGVGSLRCAIRSVLSCSSRWVEYPGDMVPDAAFPASKCTGQAPHVISLLSVSEPSESLQRKNDHGAQQHGAVSQRPFVCHTEG